MNDTGIVDHDEENDQKRETNTEFIERLMNFSPFGALMQIFIIEGLGTYAQHMAQDKNRLAENGMIHPDAWQDCARYLVEEINAKYGNKQSTNEGEAQ